MILELHAHTDHSRGKKIYYDGISSPEEMVKGAKEAGADGIFITDHDNISGALEAQKFGEKYGVKVFVGEEVSTKSGHMLALGIHELIRPGMTVDETLDEIHRQGGIGIAVHPFDIRREGMGYECLKCDAIEVFNSMNLDRYANKKAMKIAREKGMPVIAGSDAHWERMLGHGQIEVKSDNLEGILNDIKNGRVTIKKMEYVRLRTIMNMSLGKLRKSHDHILRYIEKNYSWPKKQISRCLLRLTTRDTIGLGSFYKFLTLIAFGSVVIYSQARRII
ncbi:MAG: PHP domain-containing protein [Candidatus Aenigmatarchaeota archaeon]|nr:PHP domain-containing protein [Nanoarchaeota archaeon]